MQRALKQRAKVVPVGLGVGQMEVPDRVDRLRRRHIMRRYLSQIEEPAVFSDRAIGIAVAPSLLGGQTSTEWACGVRIVELEVGEVLP